MFNSVVNYFPSMRMGVGSILSYKKEAFMPIGNLIIKGL